MPLAGDQGELTFRRTTVVDGSEPPARDPITAEYETLAKTNPKQLVIDAMAFLGRYGVPNPVCGLGSEPPLVLLGEPHLVVRGASRIVVSKVLNSEIKEWGLLTSVPAASDNGSFTDRSTAPGFYSGDPLSGQYFVHAEDDGKDFYDYLTACVVDYGILFNTHSAGFAQSVYHEILHTFEGRNLSPSTILKEGFVERFADLFIKGTYGLAFPLFQPYVRYVQDVDKLIEYAPGGLRSCAKAYFADDIEALKEIVPCCYKPIRNLQSALDRITDECQMQMSGVQAVRDLLSQFNMKKPGSWYRKWVAENGGRVPVGGVALPP